MRLTMKKIGQINEPGRYRDDEGPRGLYLQLKQKSGTRKLTGSWVLRYERSGVEKMLGLGPLSEVDLGRAREAARERRDEIRRGIDPLVTKRAEHQKRALQTTFQEASLQHIQRNKAGWKNEKHAAQWTSTLRTWAFPLIGSLSVREVDTAAVMRVLAQEPRKHPGKTLWEALPETANRVRGRIERVLDAVKASGLREGDNPARLRGHLDNLLPKIKAVKRVRHHPALPFEQIPSFMTDLAKREGIAARALEFTILTAARSNEVIGAQRTEIIEGLWTIPAERMKAKRPHRVPLTPAALAAFNSAPYFEGNDFIFVSPTHKDRPLSSGALAAALKSIIGYRDRAGAAITVHGFRSTFKDWARETTAFPNEIVEAALAHIIGDATERAYARGDVLAKRAKLMEAWAKFCTMPPVKSAEIVNIRRRTGG